jgi:hypothetical protein
MVVLIEEAEMVVVEAEVLPLTNHYLVEEQEHQDKVMLVVLRNHKEMVLQAQVEVQVP